MYLLRSLAHFLIELSCFLLLSFKSFLFSLDNNFLTNMAFPNIFSQSVDCLLILLKVISFIAFIFNVCCLMDENYASFFFSFLAECLVHGRMFKEWMIVSLKCQLFLCYSKGGLQISKIGTSWESLEMKNLKLNLLNKNLLNKNHSGGLWSLRSLSFYEPTSPYQQPRIARSQITFLRQTLIWKILFQT